MDHERKKYYDFVDLYVSNPSYFEPSILSNGSDKKSRNDNNDIQFQFIEVEPHKWLFVGAYEIVSAGGKVFNDPHGEPFYYADTIRLTEYKNMLIE